MVSTTLNNVPLDPTTTMHTRQPPDNTQQGLKAHKLSEVEMTLDRNVAPYVSSSYTQFFALTAC